MGRCCFLCPELESASLDSEELPVPEDLLPSVLGFLPHCLWNSQFSLLTCPATLASQGLWQIYVLSFPPESWLLVFIAYTEEDLICGLFFRWVSNLYRKPVTRTSSVGLYS